MLIRQPQYLIDANCAGCNHGQPVEAKGDPGGWRHADGKSGQEVFVQRPVLAGDCVAAGAICCEARALFLGVGQLDKGVGELDAADEQLEALGDARIGRVAPGQGCLCRGPVGQERRMRAADARLNTFQQQAEEQVLPGFAVAQPRVCRGGKRRRIVRGGQQVGADIDARRPRRQSGVRSVTRSVVTPRQVTTGGSTARR